MSQLSAQQLIFTRVEPSYSPYRRSGYQTVYKSPTLSELLVKAIEARIQCFSPRQPVIRLQYFMPERDIIALTHTTLVEPDREIIDSSSRSGAFAVHCLILTSTQFAAVHYNPFVIFDNYNEFVSDAREMVRRFGQATGTAEPATLSIAPSKVPVVERWTSDDLMKLVAWGMSAYAMKQQKQSLLLFGEADGIWDTLRATFLFLPEKERLHCSFDTFIERCVYPRGFYWAVGANSSGQSDVTVKVDIDQKSVLGSLDVGAVAKDGFYLSWLTERLSHREPEGVLQKAQGMQNLAKEFEGRSPISERFSPEVVQEFWVFHRQNVLDRIHSALEVSLGDATARALFPYLQRRLDEIALPALLSVASTQKWREVDLSLYLLSWLLETHPELKDKDLQRIKAVAQQNGNARLLLLASVYNDKVDEETRVKALQSMDAKTYKTVLQDCLFTYAEPAALVTAPHLLLLLKEKGIEQVDEQQFVNLVQEIINVGAGDKLALLIPGVKKLESKALLQIEKSLKQGDGINEQFQKAVAVRRKELGKPSLLDRLPFGR